MTRIIGPTPGEKTRAEREINREMMKWLVLGLVLGTIAVCGDALIDRPKPHNTCCCNCP